MRILGMMFLAILVVYSVREMYPSLMQMVYVQFPAFMAHLFIYLTLGVGFTFGYFARRK